MCKIKIIIGEKKFIDKEIILVVAREGGGGLCLWRVCKISEGGQNVLTLIYKVNKSWECNVYHVSYGQWYCILCLLGVKRVDFKSSHNKGKKFATMCDDGC